MAPSSLSLLYLSNQNQANPFPSLIPKRTYACLPLHPQTLAFSSKRSTQNQNEPQNQNQNQKLNCSQPDKKSFAIAPGKLLLSIAWQLIKSRNNRKEASTGSETGFLTDGLNGATVHGGGRVMRYDSKERIDNVIEDEIEPDVIWEQRTKDVEAEQKRRVVTSPGFSFSAARLLFPYHLGVAHFLIGRQNQNQNQKLNCSQPDKKSFAIATGKLLLSIAWQLIKSRNNRKEASTGSETGFLTDGSNGATVHGGGRVMRYDSKERIGNVIEDEIEPDVIWEQRTKDVEAEQKRRVVTSPGFSFSAAGLLFPYHLGVAHFLIEKGYIKETTPLAGSSSGAIVCAVIASGASMEEALTATKVLADDCRRRGTAFRLGAVLRDVLDKFLPEDAHTRANGRVRIAVTQILGRPQGLLVDQLDSKEDLINALVASSFIPGFLAPQPATLFRNRLCIDGAVTMLMPPTSAAQTVRVCAFPATKLGLQGIGISPDCNPENRGSAREILSWALKPAEDDVIDRMFELGYLDAAVWAEENPAAEVVEYDFPSVKNGSA